MSGNYQAKILDTDRGSIFYHDHGAGDPLILLHGGGPGATGLSNFSKNIDALAERFRVIVPDQPGFGQTLYQHDHADGMFGSRATAIFELMDALDISKASFIGNSLGAGTAFLMAMRRPERVDKLVQIGPGGLPPLFSPWPTEGMRRVFDFYTGEPTLEKMRGVLSELVHDPKTMTDEMLRIRYEAATSSQSLKNPPVAALGRVESDEIWRGNLSGLLHDVLMIWGRDDRMTPLDGAFVALRTLPNCELHVFPNCGHWAQWEWAETFNKVVLEFLTRGVVPQRRETALQPMRGSYDERRGAKA